MILRPTKILLDSNLLLLLAVGAFDRTLIGQNRLDEFTADHFDFLAEYTDSFGQKFTTPHLLAEVNNLADRCVPKRRIRAFRDSFEHFVSEFDEHWASAIRLSETEAFLQLGLADAAIVELADDRTEVVSIDLELCASLDSLGIHVINFRNFLD